MLGHRCGTLGYRCRSLWYNCNGRRGYKADLRRRCNNFRHICGTGGVCNAEMRAKAKHGREGWWSRGLLGEADHFPVGKTRGPKARGQNTSTQHGREGWWSRGLLGEADHFPVGKASGPKARGQNTSTAPGEADHFPVGEASGPKARGQTGVRT